MTVDGVGDTADRFGFRLLDLTNAPSLEPSTPVADTLRFLNDAPAVRVVDEIPGFVSDNGIVSALDLVNPYGGFQLPHTLLDGATDVTIEFWYKTSNGGVQTILSTQDAAEDNSLLLRFTDAETFEVSGEATWAIERIDDSRWHHYALRRDASNNTLSLFVDGVLQGDRDVTAVAALDVAEGGIWLGQDRNILNQDPVITNTANGRLDELRIWSTPRTANEIGEGRLQSIAVDSLELEGYFPFDEMTGRKAANVTSKTGPAAFVSRTPSSGTAAFQFTVDAGDRFYFDSLTRDQFSRTPYWRVITPFGDQLFSSGAQTDFGPSIYRTTAPTLCYWKVRSLI